MQPAGSRLRGGIGRSRAYHRNRYRFQDDPATNVRGQVGTTKRTSSDIVDDGGEDSIREEIVADAFRTLIDQFPIHVVLGGIGSGKTRLVERAHAHVGKKLKERVAGHPAPCQLHTMLVTYKPDRSMSRMQNTCALINSLIVQMEESSPASDDFLLSRSETSKFHEMSKIKDLEHWKLKDGRERLCAILTSLFTAFLNRRGSLLLFLDGLNSMQQIIFGRAIISARNDLIGRLYDRRSDGRLEVSVHIQAVITGDCPAVVLYERNDWICKIHRLSGLNRRASRRLFHSIAHQPVNVSSADAAMGDLSIMTWKEFARFVPNHALRPLTIQLTWIFLALGGQKRYEQTAFSSSDSLILSLWERILQLLEEKFGKDAICDCFGLTTDTRSVRNTSQNDQDLKSILTLILEDQESSAHLVLKNAMLMQMMQERYERRERNFLDRLLDRKFELQGDCYRCAAQMIENYNELSTEQCCLDILNVVYYCHEFEQVRTLSMVSGCERMLHSGARNDRSRCMQRVRSVRASFSWNGEKKGWRQNRCRNEEADAPWTGKFSSYHPVSRVVENSIDLPMNDTQWANCVCIELLMLMYQKRVSIKIKSSCHTLIMMSLILITMMEIKDELKQKTVRSQFLINRVFFPLYHRLKRNSQQLLDKFMEFVPDLDEIMRSFQPVSVQENKYDQLLHAIIARDLDMIRTLLPSLDQSRYISSIWSQKPLDVCCLVGDSRWFESVVKMMKEQRSKSQTALELEYWLSPSTTFTIACRVLSGLRSLPRGSLSLFDEMMQASIRGEKLAENFAAQENEPQRRRLAALFETVKILNLVLKYEVNLFGDRTIHIRRTPRIAAEVIKRILDDFCDVSAAAMMKTNITDPATRAAGGMTIVSPNLSMDVSLHMRYQWLPTYTCNRLLLSDEMGRTPLHAASLSGNKESLDRLLGLRCDVARQDWRGWNALHVACERGNSSVVSSLLQADHKIALAADDGGRTPLHVWNYQTNRDVCEAYRALAVASACAPCKVQTLFRSTSCHLPPQPFSSSPSLSCRLSCQCFSQISLKFSLNEHVGKLSRWLDAARSLRSSWERFAVSLSLR
eukprot:767903-Hanusia_phi.AAC.15